jgi:hypothetical protein
MSNSKHHEHHKSDSSESSEQANEAAQKVERTEQFDGTEDPIEREHDESVAREIRSTTPIRLPGI